MPLTCVFLPVPRRCSLLPLFLKTLVYTCKNCVTKFRIFEGNLCLLQLYASCYTGTVWPEKRYIERRIEFRANLITEMLNYLREQLVWVDEMGSDLQDALRQYGYDIWGETPQCHRFQVRGQRISAVAAISSAGVLTTDLFYGTVNSDNFYDFARRSLLLHMHSYDGVAPKSVVIMDNCSIHHVNPVLA